MDTEEALPPKPPPKKLSSVPPNGPTKFATALPSEQAHPSIQVLFCQRSGKIKLGVPLQTTMASNYMQVARKSEQHYISRKLKVSKNLQLHGTWDGRGEKGGGGVKTYVSSMCQHGFRFFRRSNCVLVVTLFNQMVAS
jgi:hypothetical protein